MPHDDQRVKVAIGSNQGDPNVHIDPNDTRFDQMVDPDFDDTEMDADLARVLADVAWHSAMRSLADLGAEWAA